MSLKKAERWSETFVAQRRTVGAKCKSIKYKDGPTKKPNFLDLDISRPKSTKRYVHVALGTAFYSDAESIARYSKKYFDGPEVLPVKQIDPATVTSSAPPLDAASKARILCKKYAKYHWLLTKLSRLNKRHSPKQIDLIFKLVAEVKYSIGVKSELQK